VCVELQESDEKEYSIHRLPSVTQYGTFFIVMFLAFSLSLSLPLLLSLLPFPPSSYSPSSLLLPSLPSSLTLPPFSLPSSLSSSLPLSLPSSLPFPSFSSYYTITTNLYTLKLHVISAKFLLVGKSHCLSKKGH